MNTTFNIPLIGALKSLTEKGKLIIDGVLSFPPNIDNSPHKIPIDKYFYR